MGVLFEHPELAQELQQVFTKAKQPDTSYALRLDEGQLRWLDGSTGKLWTHEPQTTWPKRALVRILGWLPMESQL